MKSWLKANALSVVSFAGFLIFLVLQAIFGWHVYNEELSEGSQPAVGFMAYLGSGHFGEAVFENWESEFLQMGFFVVLTAYLVQLGSAESKKTDEPQHDDTVTKDSPEPVKRGGLWRLAYEYSLPIVLFGLFLLSFVSHVFTGAAEYNKEQELAGQPPVSVGEFLFSSDFWFQSMQNWQSEFLAVGTLVVLTIFLRQKGSPQSKPVTAPHSQTGA